ncbi:MAG: response regulator transcription factor [Sedimentisphaerales bacterium]|nr:response regulator transcription factor [Sedimentisphaerales bacterium]
MDNSEPTVFVIDEEIVCDSIRLLIEGAGLNVETYGDPHDFLAAYDGRGGCLVLEMLLRRMNGLEFLSRLRENSITLPSLIVTGHGDVAMAVKAMKAGVVDYIEKPFESGVFMNAVNHALAIDRWQRCQRQACADIEAKIAKLTRREREVMDLLVMGRTTRRIAYELEISPKTVDFHRGNIMTKMGVDSPVTLALLTIRAGSICNVHDITQRALAAHDEMALIARRA